MANFNRLQFAEVMIKDYEFIEFFFTEFTSNTPFAADLIIFQNFTDINIMLGIGEKVDHVPLSANGYIVIDLNIETVDAQRQLAKDTPIYVRRLAENPAPTTGAVYISIIYNRKK